MPSKVLYTGKKKIQTNDGRLEFAINDNRILMKDDTDFRFVAGDRQDGDTQVLISRTGENVLEV